MLLLFLLMIFGTFSTATKIVNINFSVSSLSLFLSLFLPYPALNLKGDYCHQCVAVHMLLCWMWWLWVQEILCPTCGIRSSDV